jgi:benzoate membrane transport protein
MNATKRLVFSLFPPAVSGLVAVIVGFTSTAAIVFQAATRSGASPAEVSSWIAALCAGAGIISITFSLAYRMPILGAWSTPGAALLAAGASNSATLPEIIGAFFFCGLLVTISGVTGTFQKVLKRIPTALASAMLAGVLFRFGVDVFVIAKTDVLLILVMLSVYVVLKNTAPRFAILGVIGAGVGMSVSKGLIHLPEFQFEFTRLVWTTPEFSWSPLINIGFPLFIVTMASQNLTGFSMGRAFGYNMPVSSITTGLGVITTLLAPFGAFSINLAAITAAICMGPDAHEDPKKRYIATVSAGIFYLLIAALGATVTTLFHAFPHALLVGTTGIALFSPIGSNLGLALREESTRETTLITFLVTASGFSYAGMGSAFWGLTAGGILFLLAQGFRRVKVKPKPQP